MKKKKIETKTNFCNKKKEESTFLIYYEWELGI